MADIVDIFTGRPVTNLAEREAAQAGSQVAVVAKRLAVGSTLDNGSLRTHRYRDHLVLWDLTHAGKRGKKVAKLSVSPSYTLSAATSDAVLEQIAILLENLNSYEPAAAILTQLSEVTKQLDLNRVELRGVDVAPASFEPITIKTEAIELRASYSDFQIECLADKHNLPTACPADNSKKSIPKFYQWVSANRERIKKMTYREVLVAMLEEGIRFHAYCAMD